MPFALSLRGRLSSAVLASSLGAIVERHEALRTTFPERNDAPVQRIASLSPVSLPLIDLSALPDSGPEARRLAVLESLRPFDLAAGPLLRALLIRNSFERDEHVLLVTLHHIVCDGWSIGVMTQELGALYSALIQGQPVPLAPLPVQYADFALWQRSWLRSEELEKQLVYWRGRLTGAPGIDGLIDLRGGIKPEPAPRRGEDQHQERHDEDGPEPAPPRREHKIGHGGTLT
jgi:hypothetical protein